MIMGIVSVHGYLWDFMKGSWDGFLLWQHSFYSCFGASSYHGGKHEIQDHYNCFSDNWIQVQGILRSIKSAPQTQMKLWHWTTTWTTTIIAAMIAVQIQLYLPHNRTLYIPIGQLAPIWAKLTFLKKVLPIIHVDPPIPPIILLTQNPEASEAVLTRSNELTEYRTPPKTNSMSTFVEQGIWKTPLPL
jgi:hypothetical protein